MLKNIMSAITQKGFANIVLVMVVVVLASVGGYYFFKKPANVVVIPTPTITPTATKTAVPTKTATPNPTAGWKTYTNADLGYSIKYPPTWKVDESGLQSSLSKEVIINPVNPEPFISYVSVSIDQRSIDQIRQVHNNSQAPIFIEKQITFAGQSTFQYTVSGSDSVEIYIPYQGKIFLVSSSKFSSKEVKQSFSSFRFTKLAITSLRPISGPVGTSVTITGSGFTTNGTGNRIKFGNLGSEENPSYNLNSADGKTLVFTVPSSNYFACWFFKGEVPPCTIPATST